MTSRLGREKSLACFYSVARGGSTTKEYQLTSKPQNDPLAVAFWPRLGLCTWQVSHANYLTLDFQFLCDQPYWIINLKNYLKIIMISMTRLQTLSPTQ